jgi:chemotaxis protein CheD
MPATTETVVGISALRVSADLSEVLVTYSLGSCIGLSLYDPVARVGGLLHAMMPVSTADPVKASATPAMYTDTGVAALLQGVFDLGATRGNIVARVAGGAAQMDGSGLFRIGERNNMVLRKVLWKNDILIAASDVGGAASRTLSLEMATGRTLVKSNGTVVEL